MEGGIAFIIDDPHLLWLLDLFQHSLWIEWAKSCLRPPRDNISRIYCFTSCTIVQKTKMLFPIMFAPLDIIVRPSHDIRSLMSQIHRNHQVGVYGKCTKEGDRGLYCFRSRTSLASMIRGCGIHPLSIRRVCYSLVLLSKGRKRVESSAD